MLRTSTTLRAARAGIAHAILAFSVFARPVVSDERAPETRTATSVFAELVEAHRSGDEATSAMCVDALSAHSRPVWRSIAERAAEPGRSVDIAKAALLLLRRLGGADDVALGASLHRDGAGPDLEATLIAIVARDTRTLGALDRLVRSVPREVVAIFVRAVETARTPEAAVWLARCADRAPEVRGEALARLGRLAESLPNPAPEEALEVVRTVLAGIGSDALRDAIIATGRMEDGDAIPHLIALLADEDPGLRSDAAWALERITGLKLRERRERWEDWYATELAWWRDRSDAAFSDLESADFATRTRAMLEISSRRSSRDRLALRVIPLLDHADTATAKMAAWTLRSLRAKCAVGPLIRALDHTDPAVRLEAWRSLRGITRKDLPEDAAQWRAACAA